MEILNSSTHCVVSVLFGIGDLGIEVLTKDETNLIYSMRCGEAVNKMWYWKTLMFCFAMNTFL